MPDFGGEEIGHADAGILGAVTRTLAIAGGLLMVSMAVMVTVSVVMRWLMVCSLV